MKYFKRAGIYKASNVTFNPNTIEAHSYVWWKFVAKIDGKVIFNNHYYSPSTRKHQNKVESLMNDLGIKIDITAPFPKGITQTTLSEAILAAEENLCNQYLEDQLKIQNRNEKAKVRRFKKKLESYLDQVAFRDYEIKPKTNFGHYNKIAVHQVVEDIEHDVQNALNNFHRDGFGSIVFYIGGN